MRPLWCLTRWAVRYDKGEIDIFGEKMTPDSYELKKNIGIVPQEIAVFDELTVRQNIDYFCGLYINDRKKRKKLVDKAIDFVGLEKYIKMYPRQLSGGLLRRLNIACGIAHEPKIIIMDEPTVAVDPQSRNNILEGIKRLNFCCRSSVGYRSSQVLTPSGLSSVSAGIFNS